MSMLIYWRVDVTIVIGAPSTNKHGGEISMVPISPQLQPQVFYIYIYIYIYHQDMTRIYHEITIFHS